MSDAPVLCFADTDCLLKLAAADLWHEALAVLGVSAEQVRITTETGDRLGTQVKKFTHNLTPVGYRRAVAIVRDLKLIETTPDPSEEILVGKIIDAGEAVLVCATRHEPSFILISADRHWPEDLASVSYLQAVRDRLAGRCICFEQIVLLLIQSATPPDYLTIARRFSAIPDCHNTLFRVFPDGERTPKQHAIAQLKLTIENLRRVSGDFLAE